MPTEFSITRLILKESTCLKTQTAASVFKDGAWISSGANLCAPHGIEHGQCVSDCPRMATTTGSNYELCSPVHAEVMACLSIRRNREPKELAKFAGHLTFTQEEILAAFTLQELEQLQGATLFLVGHYWACDNCLFFLKTVGIPKENVQFDQLTGEATKQRYQAGGLTKDETIH